ncbi:MAG: ankyrin repeat domain-containing protein [Oleibacter sp.]|nr:ankyrin repeat domain-containing protein [Thalassolituus sp.]
MNLITQKSRNILKDLSLVFFLLINLSVYAATSDNAATMDDAMNAARIRDYPAMASILSTLAESGNKKAQYQLAKLYRNGLGVDKDLKKAFIWSDKAAQQGLEKAISFRNTLCEKTTDCELDIDSEDTFEDTLNDQQISQASREELLRKAARRNEKNRVMTLINAGVNINTADQFGRTPLLEAIDNGSTEVAVILVSSGANVNHKDIRGETPLSLSVAKSDVKTTAQLLDAGADVNAVDKQGNTVIFNAISQDNEALVKLLLQHKAAVNIIDKQDMTPLTLAERKNSKNIIALLKQAGAKEIPNAQAAVPLSISDNEAQLFKDWPDLMIAAWLGQPDRLAGFLKEGAQIDETDNEGHTALTRAAWRGNTDIVKQLLHAGAKINHQDSLGRTAIAWSLASQPHKDTMLLLIANKADVNIQDMEGKSALRLAVEQKQLELVDKLLNAGANPNLADKENVTPLQRATILNQPSIIESLLKHNSKTNMQDVHHRDALWYAADEGSSTIIQTLLRAGATTNTADQHGQRSLERSVLNQCQSCLELLVHATPNKELFLSKRDGNSLLTLAADSGNLSAVNFLITKDFPIDARNNKGNTALMLAASKGHSNIVEALISAGSDSLLRNSQKQNALDLAEKSGHQETAELLKKHGISKDKIWKIITG